MINEYKRGGDLLIEEFTEYCQTKLNDHKAATASVKLALKDVFARTKADLEDAASRYTGRTASLERTLGRSQGEIRALTEAALDICHGERV